MSNEGSMDLTVDEIVAKAIDEDLPQEDMPTDNLGLREKPGRAFLKAKEDLVLSGSELFQSTMNYLDGNVHIEWYFSDGDFVFKDQTVSTITGNLLTIVKAERVALNFLGQLTGVATLTRCYVSEVEGLPTKILDTRKTTPLMRQWQKAAVRHGGGHSHRDHLSQAILIKENHIRICGGIEQCVKRLRERTSEPIEVECGTLSEVEQAVTMKVERILLDNMNNETIREALTMISGEITTEASGNMSLERIRSVAEMGVDFISVGSLTHSAPCADLSLLLEDEY